MYQAPMPPERPLRIQDGSPDVIIFLLTILLGGGVLFLNLIVLESIHCRVVSSAADAQTLGRIIVALGLVPGLVVGGVHYALFWGTWSRATPWLHASIVGWTLGAALFILVTRMEHVVGHPLQRHHLGACLMLVYPACGALTGFLYWRVYRIYHPGFARRGWRAITAAGFVLISAAGFFVAEAMLLLLLGRIGLHS